MHKPVGNLAANLPGWETIKSTLQKLAVNLLVPSSAALKAAKSVNWHPFLLTCVGIDCRTVRRPRAQIRRIYMISQHKT
jgi:hypothetical protein